MTALHFDSYLLLSDVSERLEMMIRFRPMSLTFPERDLDIYLTPQVRQLLSPAAWLQVRAALRRGA